MYLTKVVKTAIWFAIATVGAVAVRAQSNAAVDFGSFTVGGSSSSYYPVQFVSSIYGASPGSLGANTSDLVIYRNNTHENGTWYGTINFVLSVHPSDWGHFGGEFEKLSYQTGTGTPYNDPIGDVLDGSAAGSGDDIIIWLKGGATYHWRNKETTANWSLANPNSAGGSITDSSGVSRGPITSQSALIVNSKNRLYLNAIGFATAGDLGVGGNVGIGTTSPAFNLHVNGSSGAFFAADLSGSSSNPVSMLRSATPTSSASGKNEQFVWYLNEDANWVPGRAISLWQYPSDSIGGCCHMHAIFGVNSSGANYQYFSGNVGIGTNSPTTKLEVYGSLKLSAGSGGTLSFPDGTSQSTAWTGALCGGDYAESINVSDDRTHYQPGDVLVIDDDHPGGFLKSAQTYSSAVAGIYSTKPGMVGRRQQNPKTAEEIPMAMIGIVPVKVSAENGPIRMHDLLVSSSTPGYAMKGTDRNRMLGSVIGKALGTLDSGTGTIEVLVSLQ